MDGGGQAVIKNASIRKKNDEVQEEFAKMQEVNDLKSKFKKQPD